MHTEQDTGGTLAALRNFACFRIASHEKKGCPSSRSIAWASERTCAPWYEARVSLDPEITCSGEPFPFPADMDDEPLRRHMGGYPEIPIEDGIRITHEAFVQLADENRMPELPA